MDGKYLTLCSIQNVINSVLMTSILDARQRGIFSKAKVMTKMKKTFKNENTSEELHTYYNGKMSSPYFFGMPLILTFQSFALSRIQ